MSRLHLSLTLSLAVTLLSAPFAGAAALPPSLKSMLEKSASLGLDRFPVGFWNYASLGTDAAHLDEAAVAEWAEAGFTVTMSPSFDPSDPEQVQRLRALLTYAEQRGLKLILSDPRTEGPRRSAAGGEVTLPPDQASRIAAAAAGLAGHPAVFGFHIGDEPDLPLLNAYMDCARLTKEAAPRGHPFLNLLPYYSPALDTATSYPTWNDAVTLLAAAARRGKLDFLSYDCYTQMLPDPLGVDIYFGNLRLYRETAWRAGIPFWATLLAVGHFDYRCPSYDDLRWQFNTAIASGAQGILWFHYYLRGGESNYRLAPVDENWERTATYDHLRHFQKLFHRRYGDLFVRLAPTRVTFWPQPRGGSAVFSPDELVAAITVDSGLFVDPQGVRHEPRDPEHPLLLGEFADAEGRRYVMLVNNSTEKNVRVALTFPGSDVEVFSWDNGREREGPAYSADVNSRRTQERDERGLRIWHWLAPGQEAVYRVDSAAIRRARITTQAEATGPSFPPDR